jgi:GNAT superfamily N-acetyltransferase
VTASTDSGEHALTGAHLPGCLALSKSAHWNQNEADWRVMLAIGRGWGITLGDGTLAASTIVLPYGGKFAWISMVLVLPEQRRKGFASQLLKRALRENAALGLTSILDATPAGHKVYIQEGFQDRWGFKRFALNAPTTGFMPVAEVRPLQPKDWAPLLALDLRAFGASRERLLRNLAGRLPAAALMAERDGALTGFVLGREGREANQVGPVVAQNEETALVLLNAALAGARAPVYVDIADHAPTLQAWAQARGFEFQRPFTRMLHGPEGKTAAGPAPGEAALVFCPAGPELG